MHPLLRFTIYVIAVIFFIFFLIQLNNLVCAKSGRCRPFLLSYYYTKYKYKDTKIEIINLFQVNNRNKNVEVKLDYDKKFSRLGDIIKIKIYYKNLTNKNIAVKNNFNFEYDIFNDFYKMLKCPCTSKLIVKANQTLVVEMEFFISLFVSNSKIEEFQSFINVNKQIFKVSDNQNEDTELTVKMNLDID